MSELSGCGGICCAIITLASVIMFSLSFETIDPLNSGLIQDSLSKTVGETPYISGRYFVGLTSNFITYPTTLQTISFTRGSEEGRELAASTKDGQQINLEVTMQYRLRLDSLFELYKSYTTNYHGQYVTKAENAIKNVAATTYSTQDFFDKREVIGETMHVAVNKALYKDFCVVEHFQLLKVTPPAATDLSVLNKIIEQQRIIIATVEKQTTLIKADSVLIIKSAEAEATVIQAAAQKNADVIIGAARADQTKVHLNYMGETYAALGAAMSYSPAQLLRHMMYEHIRTLDGEHDVLTVDFPSALFSI